MSGTTHYRIYVHPLPLLPSNDDQTSNHGDHSNSRGDVLDVVTGIFEEYSKHLLSLLAENFTSLMLHCVTQGMMLRLTLALHYANIPML